MMSTGICIVQFSNLHICIAYIHRPIDCLLTASAIHGVSQSYSIVVKHAFTERIGILDTWTTQQRKHISREMAYSPRLARHAGQFS